MKKCITLIICLFSLNAAAKCNQAEADKGVQPELNDCAYENYQAADKQLNALYKKLIVKTEADAKESHTDAKLAINKLKLAQNAWVKFRDADCKYASFAFEGGQAQPMEEFGCLESKTEQRMKDIQEMLTGS